MNFTGLISDSISSNNASRQQKQRSRIVKCLSKSEEPLTIPEIANVVRISLPTAIKLTNELIDSKWVIEEGKKETESGRRPTLYTLNKELICAVGVEILLKSIQVTILKIGFDVIISEQDKTFVLENTQECLDKVIAFIAGAISKSGRSKDQIMGIGIGITGRVNTNTGESITYFNFLDKPLANYVEEQLLLPTVIDNDTRVQGIAENVLGKGKNTQNTLIINMSRGLGMSILLDKKIVRGEMGFAGEFGHMHFGQENRHCMCGKQGCLGTEVSGYALEEDLKNALAKGETSINFSNDSIEPIRYDAILNAAINGDALAINLIQNQGEKLGSALGNIINLLNPSLIVIGGKFARVKDIFTDPVKMGLKKTALMNAANVCKIVSSELTEQAGPQGAACLVFGRNEMI
ncbi:MAG: ROK family protein [Bacteroidetes bacterium]|nr:ROK family protein [Bacteroidota bacterium]